MKSKLFYTQLFGLLLLLLLILLVVPKYTKIIPSILKHRVERVLEKNNLHWVSVRVHDRDVVLSGVAPTVEAHKRAVKLSKTVSAIRSVSDKISPMFIAPYTMNITYDGKQLHLKGYMPSKLSKELLFSKVSSIYGDAFVDEVDIGAGEPKAWGKFIRTVVNEMKSFDISSVNIVDNELHVSGKIATEHERMGVETSLNSFKKQGYNIHCHMVAMDAAAKVCQEKFNILLGQEKIEFQSNKSIIKAKNNRLLNELSDTALLCPNVKIEIIGHTDSLGNDLKNRELSLSRAKAVVAKLFALGIPLERMEAEGRGESEPIANNATDEGRAKNRRIEFKVKGEK